MEKPLKILSCGAGVQSTVLALMSCRQVSMDNGEQMPLLDHVIFSDTGAEPAAVYRHVEWLKAEVESYGVPFHVVSNGNITEHLKEGMVKGSESEKRYATIPAYVASPDGGRAILRRQCTDEFKIKPVERKIRQILGLKPRQRAPINAIEHWFGISADETRRARVSKHRWETNRYPLIFDKRMRRHECINWFAENYNRDLPRSSCVFCPFHDNTEWRRLTAAEFESACEMDELIRTSAQMRGKLYLHRSLTPLREADLRTQEEKGQMNWLDECCGVCGV